MLRCVYWCCVSGRRQTVGLQRYCNDQWCLEILNFPKFHRKNIFLVLMCWVTGAAQPSPVLQPILREWQVYRYTFSLLFPQDWKLISGFWLKQAWSQGWTGSCFRLHCWVWRFLCCWRWAEGWFWQWLFSQLWSRNCLRWGRLQWFLRWFWWRGGRRLWQCRLVVSDGANSWSSNISRLTGHSPVLRKPFAAVSAVAAF